jgi:hypothetical protein
MSTQPTIRRLLPENMRVDSEGARHLRATKRLSYDRHTVKVAANDGAEVVQGGQEKVGHHPATPIHRSVRKGILRTSHAAHSANFALRGF